jgi:trigger factor
MNATLENLPNCQANLRIEVSPEEVKKTMETVLSNFAGEVKLPGYRPGKVPRSMVATRFKKEIREESRRQLVQKFTEDAVTEKDLKIVTRPEVIDFQWNDNDEVQFSATMYLVPEFMLPHYKGLIVSAPTDVVTEDEVERALQEVREQCAEFPKLEEERAAQMGDYVVVDYAGTIDGAPVKEVFPKAGDPLTGNTKFWILMTEEAFFPGFCASLVGANIGETREFDITVPTDFPVEGMPGTVIHYRVTLVEIRRKILPELNDEFAVSTQGLESLDALRTEIRSELQKQKKAMRQQCVRSEIMAAICGQVECELPPPLVEHEARKQMNMMIRGNLDRGISEEVLRENSRELAVAAGRNARTSVKGNLIMMKIAAAENISITDEEMGAWLSQMANQEGMSLTQKIAQVREDPNLLSAYRSDILRAKTLDFLVNSATIADRVEPNEPADLK